MKRNSLSFHFSSWFLSLGLSFPKESPITINFLLVQYGIAVNYVGAYTDATWRDEDGYSIIQANPFYIARNGHFWASQFKLQAINGNLWSNATSSDTVGYYFGYGSGVVIPAYQVSRGAGVPVRCIGR